MTLKDEIKWLDNYVKKQVKQGAEVTFLRAILQRLKLLDKKEPPSPYHNAAMGFYFKWLESQGLPAVRSPSQGSAMKGILKQLKDASNDKTDEAALESFKVILKYWNRLNHSLAVNKQLSSINKNLLEIIDKIKNGATKQSSSIMETVSLHDRISRKYRNGNGENG